jgi:hypothetical protein
MVLLKYSSIYEKRQQQLSQIPTKNKKDCPLPPEYIEQFGYITGIKYM